MVERDDAEQAEREGLFGAGGGQAEDGSEHVERGRGEEARGADSLPGLACALMWAVSPVFTVEGLEGLDSPLLGVTLGMIASVEAIFVLINQNRLARVEEERAELALQVELLSEQETSRVMELSARIAEHLGVEVPPVGGGRSYGAGDLSSTRSGARSPTRSEPPERPATWRF